MHLVETNDCTVGESSHTSLFSLHGFFFIFPSQHRLICLEREGKKLLWGSWFNQLPDYSNNPYFSSFSGLQL